MEVINVVCSLPFILYIAFKSLLAAGVITLLNKTGITARLQYRFGGVFNCNFCMGFWLGAIPEIIWFATQLETTSVVSVALQILGIVIVGTNLIVGVIAGNLVGDAEN